MTKAALLINLGTPDSPEVPEVRAYLAQFLMDPYVIDIPYPLRWFLINGIILPRRPKASSEAYKKIWTERGSPLLFHHLDLTSKVQGLLGDTWKVVPAMRYGKPSIESAVREIAALSKTTGIEELKVFPLYPQYSLAATESSVVEARRAIAKHLPNVRTTFVGPFFSDRGFIDAFAEIARAALADFQHDFMQFSFHGLPERQVRKTDPSGGHCLAKEHCCAEVGERNAACYRAQCFATGHALARALGLAKDRYAIAFQSRLGRTPWIRPYTDELFTELPKEGIKRLAVMSPSFVADCLETLEEIKIRGKEAFLGSGGEDLRLIPSLNSSDAWARGVSNLLVGAGGA